MMKNIILLSLSTTLLFACGGGKQLNGINLTLNNTYELPYVFGSINQNVMLDDDSLIFVGGNKALPSGAQHDGHPAFSNKAIKINLITGVKQTLDIAAGSGHTFDEGTVANGRGNSAKLHKISDNKYLVSGGFQYENSIEVIDFTNENVRKIDAYYLDGVGSVKQQNGDILFVGVNSNSGGSAIARFLKSNGSFTILSTTLTIPRSRAEAYNLADGRVIIVGGHDGGGGVTLNSATRRVEIFDPSDDTIIRVADYPEPISHHVGDTLSDDSGICIGLYQYSIEQNIWSAGCMMTINNPENMTINNPENFNPSLYNFPLDNIQLDGNLKQLTNGDIIWIEGGSYSSLFSDDLLGYPVDIPTKIHVFSRAD